ncbi:unnamed protein product [Mycena citricolor]|uniref:HMG box domain-containing protein n=1 Tax=Mycena citricolor TaxID=2018698 RepID=A0AAD2HKL5_9AGAR|nr:unnamed protein product [Mycena citricolor]
MHYSQPSPSEDIDDTVFKLEDPDDEDHTLTSQTLNADGTPKRPMNAFMIFARRRRPQVSSENQSMRTGDISKILSLEWKSMPTVRPLALATRFRADSLQSEKQYFQNQAKLLKASFNERYPDYVYRRRPNNTRKRRRSDAAASTGSASSHSPSTSPASFPGPLPQTKGGDSDDASSPNTDGEEYTSRMSYSGSYSSPAYSGGYSGSYSHARSTSYPYPPMQHAHRHPPSYDSAHAVNSSFYPYDSSQSSPATHQSYGASLRKVQSIPSIPSMSLPSGPSPSMIGLDMSPPLGWSPLPSSGMSAHSSYSSSSSYSPALGTRSTSASSEHSASSYPSLPHSPGPSSSAARYSPFHSRSGSSGYNTQSPTPFSTGSTSYTGSSVPRSLTESGSPLLPGLNAYFSGSGGTDFGSGWRSETTVKLL